MRNFRRPMVVGATMRTTALLLALGLGACGDEAEPVSAEDGTSGAEESGEASSGSSGGGDTRELAPCSLEPFDVSECGGDNPEATATEQTTTRCDDNGSVSVCTWNCEAHVDCPDGAECSLEAGGNCYAPCSVDMPCPADGMTCVDVPDTWNWSGTGRCMWPER